METIIRHAEPEDYQALHEVYSQSEAFSNTLQLPFPSKEMWRKRQLETPNNATILVAEVDGTVVAGLSLMIQNNLRRRHVGFIGMAVHDDWHNIGIGSAILNAALDIADNWINLTRIELTVFTDNESAIKLYEKFGFVTEGTFKNYAFRAGSYQDVFAMARLREK